MNSGLLQRMAVVLGLVLLLASIILFAQQPATSTGAGAHTAAPLAAEASSVLRGKYLVDAGNCLTCHTRQQGEPFAGGVAFSTPFGLLYSTNITSDRETGIGNWTREDLRRAMHEGVAPGGRWLYPAFPYPSYTKVSNDDVDAIHAYLQTIAAVTYVPPNNGLLFSQRWAMRIWNALFFEPGRFVPDEKLSPEWNRGAYLVEGLAHCGACHTPRNLWMAEIRTKAHHGALVPDHSSSEQGRNWFAVNLTGATNGLAAWSESELTKYLHTGVSRRAGTFGPMNDVIVNSLKKLDVDDISAMAKYIKSLPVGGQYVGPGVPAAKAAVGSAIYVQRCEKCHGDSGRGGLFSGPPLAGSAIVQSENPASLFRVILQGPETPAEISLGQWETMPGYSDVLSDDELVAVSNYVRGSWINRARSVGRAEAARQR